MPSTNYPLIVGAGQVTNHPKAIEQTLEPLEMMERVAREAENDAGAPGLLEKVDSVLFENAIRANLGLSIEEHQRRLGELGSRFAAVAAGNPYAWFPVEHSPEEITSVRADNRMVGFPYPKLMNAIIETDQAAALIMTGSRTARELGIPEDRWVYLRGCGDATDKWFVSERLNYHSSPAIRAATQRALGMAGIPLD